MELVYNDMHMEYCNRNKELDPASLRSITAKKSAVSALLASRAIVICLSVFLLIARRKRLKITFGFSAQKICLSKWKYMISCRWGLELF